MLNQIGEGIWEKNDPLRVAGFDLNHRMTVMPLKSGEVIVHSPVDVTDELKQEVAALGKVKWVLAPSRMHDLFLADWMNAFPEAKLLHSPGMKILAVPPPRQINLSDESRRLFGDELECLLIQGMPKINEVACLHRPSRSLIVADLMFNLAPATGFQRWMQKANGVYQRLGSSRLFKMCIRDQDAFRDSLRRILEWDFDRVILGHGANIMSGGKQRLHESFDWLKI